MRESHVVLGGRQKNRSHSYCIRFYPNFSEKTCHVYTDLHIHNCSHTYMYMCIPLWHACEDAHI